MKANLKYLFKGLALGASFLILLYLAIVLYVSLNKASIINDITRSLSEKISGNVEIGKSELSFFSSFPNVAVLLRDVKVSDSLFYQHHKYSFAGKEIFFRVSIPRLLKKQPPVKALELKDASIKIFTRLDGYSNKYLLKLSEGKSNAQGSPKLYLGRLIFHNVSVDFSDSVRGKFHNVNAEHLHLKLKQQGGQISGQCVMKLKVGGIIFNPFKGSYLRNQTVSSRFPFFYNTNSGRFYFEGIPMRINDHPFTLTGSFNLLNESGDFSFLVSTKNAAYDFLTSIFPSKIQRSLALVKLGGKFDASANIGGYLNGGDPLVLVKFSTPNTSMATPFMDFHRASFSGTFSNEVVKGLPRKDPNSRITLNAFRAEWRGLPVLASAIQITNLKMPELVCEMRSQFSLEKLNQVMQSTSLRWIKGNANVHLVYTGPLTHDASTPIFMNGSIKIDGGKLNYVPRNVDINDFQAAMHFQKSDFFLDTFRAEVFGKPVRMTAEARSLLTLINTQPNAARVLWNIDLPELDLQPYMFLLQTTKRPEHKKQSTIAGTSAKIDKVLDEGKLDVNLRVGNLHFKKFTARNVGSRISFLQDRYVIHEARLEHAGGNLSFNGSLVQGASGIHRAELTSNLRAVNVQEVFESFQNFGQNGLTAENIRGNLDAEVRASLLLRESGEVIPSSTRGKVKFSLKDGELINFEPVKKIQQFIFKNRDFENIRFAELKNVLDIEGTEIKINGMEIQSSVLSMFVDGVYSTAGNTDLQIRLPLSNLRKRRKDFDPENIGPNAKRGTAILLRGRPGDDGNIKFKLDLFNKFEKERKKERK